MKKLMVVLIALSLIGAFSIPSWAQEEDPEPVQPGSTEPAAASATAAAPTDQGAAGQDVQAAATVSPCRVQSVSIGKQDEVEVGYGCFTGATRISTNILVDRDNNGFVDTVKDDSGAGQIEFRLLPVERKSDAESQYNFAMLSLNQTMQAIAIAQGNKLFRKGEKCNQYTTDKGEKYEVFAVFERSEKNQPVLVGYKVNQTVNGNTVTFDISAASLYNTVFAGIIPNIHSGGCPLREWIIFPDQS